MTGWANENDAVDIDRERDSDYETKGSQHPPKTINPQTVAHPANMDSTQQRATDATDPSKAQTNAEAGIPQGSVEQSQRARANQGDIEREQPQSGERKNESIEGGQRGSGLDSNVEDIEPEEDQRGAA